MTQIKTITAVDSERFDRQVNDLLGQGWRLHGPPSFTTIGQQATAWGEDRLHAWTEHHFAQVLVKG